MEGQFDIPTPEKSFNIVVPFTFNDLGLAPVESFLEWLCQYFRKSSSHLAFQLRLKVICYGIPGSKYLAIVILDHKHLKIFILPAEAGEFSQYGIILRSKSFATSLTIASRSTTMVLLCRFSVFSSPSTSSSFVSCPISLSKASIPLRTS